MEVLKSQIDMEENQLKTKIGTSHGIDFGDLGYVIWPEVKEKMEFDDKAFMKDNKATVLSLLAQAKGVSVMELEQQYMRKRGGYRTFRKYWKGSDE
jgi:hypothetical protein